MASIEEKILSADFRGTITTAIIAGLAFTVGLFWRDAIQETIDTVLPEGQGLVFTYFAAIAATIIVVVFAYVLVKLQQSHIHEKVEEEKKRRKKKKKKS